MENEKASNSRYIGPMTHAVAQELRALLARKKYSASRLSREANLAKSTLHKTLNAQRAIDVEDVFAICEFFSEDPGQILDAAAGYARQNMTGGPSRKLVDAIERHLSEPSSANVGGAGQDAHITQMVDYRENRDLEIADGTDEDVRDALADRHAALQDDDPTTEQEAPDTP